MWVVAEEDRVSHMEVLLQREMGGKGVVPRWLLGILRELQPGEAHLPPALQLGLV